MKMALALVLSGLSFAAAASVNLDQKINLDLKNATVGEVLDEIAKQTNLDFVISVGAPINEKMSIEVKEASLKNVMDSVAAKEKVKWKVEDSHTLKISMLQAPVPPQ